MVPIFRFFILMYRLVRLKINTVKPVLSGTSRDQKLFPLKPVSV
jgi:hypothetical protein